jgi:UDP-N-acetylglucosamine acyltransferase
MPNIHPTAIVDPGAVLADDVVVGPYAVVGPAVTLGAGTSLDHHASVQGVTTMGAGNRVFPFAAVGGPPQDLKYRGEPTRLEIGDRNTFREFVTVNTGTTGGGGVTRIGSDNLLMAYVHVAHDCLVGDGTVLANCATLAGHVTIHDRVIVGGMTPIHQFVRIGRNAMVGGASAVDKDIPPFMMAAGNKADLHGLNVIGLRRQGLSPETVAALKEAYRILFRSGILLREALDTLDRTLSGVPEVAHLVEFVRSSKRGITRPGGAGTEEAAG